MDETLLIGVAPKTESEYIEAIDRVIAEVRKMREDMAQDRQQIQQRRARIWANIHRLRCL